MQAIASVIQLSHAGGKPSSSAVLRTQPADFVVEETLKYSLTGSGEHVYLRLRKQGVNTEFLARQLARHYDLKQRDVSYAGLKDRHAVTTQWFSLHMPGVEFPGWNEGEIAGVKCLEVMRHDHKLRRGALLHNRFDIILRQIDGDLPDIQKRLQSVAKFGAPNYFGYQRFGRDGQNVQQAADWFTQELARNKRSNLRRLDERRRIWLSSARSFIFNQVLASRVRDDSWLHAEPGDVLMLAGSNSYFVCQNASEVVDIQSRLNKGDLHLTAPLWGQGELTSQGRIAQLESFIAVQWPVLSQGLSKLFNLKQDRRAVRVIPQTLKSRQLNEDALQVTFTLPPGAYATSVLRQCVSVSDPTAGVSGF